MEKKAKGIFYFFIFLFFISSSFVFAVGSGDVFSSNSLNVTCYNDSDCVKIKSYCRGDYWNLTRCVERTYSSCKNPGIPDSYCINNGKMVECSSCLRGTRCENGKCVQSNLTIVPICSDTDKTQEFPDGINYYLKGTVTIKHPYLIERVKEDYCDRENRLFNATSNVLNEFFCNSSGLGYRKYNCGEEGKICKGGRCVEEEKKCTDSDGGKNYFVRGIIEGSRLTTGEKPIDYCVAYSAKTLVEYRCENGGLMSESYVCPYGCFNGRCTNRNEICSVGYYCYNNYSYAYVNSSCSWSRFTVCLSGMSCRNGACVEANIHYVSPTGAGSHNGTRGNEFSLNEAQTFANNNSDERITFILNSGNYGQVTFNKQRSQYMTWKRAPDSLAKFEKIRISGASYIEFDDINVFGLGAHNQTIGIDIRNGNHITIKNSRISEAMNGIVASGYKIDINNNLIYSVGSDQIDVVSPANIIFIEKNRIFNTNPIPLAHADGIHIYGYGDNVSEVFIRNNIFNNLSGMGISSDGVRNLTIEGNNMYKVYSWDIFLSNTHTGVVTGNYIEPYGNFSWIFIRNSTCTNIQVYNNTIQTNETCGNEVINSGEVCDGSALGGKTCKDFGYTEGNLSCCKDCKNFDLSKCKNVTKTCNDKDGYLPLEKSYYIAAGVAVGGSEEFGPSCPCKLGEPCSTSPCGAAWGGFIKDKCEGDILIERICNGTEASFIEYKCPGICVEGACIGEEVNYSLACGNLNTANTIYTLINNVTSTGTCFNVTANNITLNCNGYEINYSSGGGNNEYGIYSNYNFTTIKNCRIKEGLASGYDDFAIYFNNAKNGTIENNTITTSGGGGYGISLSSSSNSNLLSNTITTSGTAGVGIYLALSSNSNLLSNTITTSGNPGIGIYLYLSSNSNTVSSNTITTSGGDGYGILLESSSNSNLSSNTIITSGINDYGILLFSSSNSNLLSNTITTSGTNGYGIYLSSSSNNNISNSNISSSLSYDVNLGASSINNIFLNTTYSISRESISPGSSLIRKWYYKAYVNDTSGNNVSNANVTAFNVSGSYNFNLTTDAIGYTQLGEIIDYINNGTRTYYSDYNITAFNSSYSLNSHAYNATLQQSNYKDVFTLSFIAGDTCTAGAGNWNVNCTDNCLWNTNQNINGNLTMSGVGNVTLKANFTFTIPKPYIAIRNGCRFTILNGGFKFS